MRRLLALAAVVLVGSPALACEGYSPAPSPTTGPSPAISSPAGPGEDQTLVLAATGTGVALLAGAAVLALRRTPVA